MISLTMTGIMHQAHRRDQHDSNLRYPSEQQRYHHRKRPPGLFAAELEPLTSQARCWKPPSTKLEDLKPRAGFIFPYPDEEDEDKDDDEDDDDDDSHKVEFPDNTDTTDHDDKAIEAYDMTIVDYEGVEKSSVDTILRTGLSQRLPAIKIG